MENHEWIAPTRFQSRDAVAGLRSIEEEVPDVDDLGQAVSTSSTRFRQAHESIASASRQHARLQSAIRESGPVAENLFAGSVFDGFSKMRLNSVEFARSRESWNGGSLQSTPGPADQGVGQEIARRSEPSGDRPASDPVSRNALGALTGMPIIDHRGRSDSRPENHPRSPSADVSPDPITVESHIPGDGPLSSNNGVSHAGRLGLINHQGTSLLGDQATLTRIHARPDSAIEDEGSGSGKTKSERSVPMNQRSLSDFQAWKSGSLIRDATPTSHPDRALIPIDPEASRMTGGMAFPAAPITGLSPPGIATNKMTRSLTSPSSLAPSAAGQWISPPRATDSSPIVDRGSESGFGASNGTIERLLREQNDLIRQDLQRDASRPIAAPPPLRNSGIRM